MQSDNGALLYHSLLQKRLTICFVFLGLVNCIIALYLFLTHAKSYPQKSSSSQPVQAEILGNNTIGRFSPGYFLPKTTLARFSTPIDITAKAYAVMDRDTGQLLYAKNFKDRLPIASVAKIMTAIVALEFAPLKEILTVSPSASTIGEATMGLTMGERLTVEELLYGAMLPSGNDAAETLAEGVGAYVLKQGNSYVLRQEAREWFIDEMNILAEKIGMTDSHFVNPTGLDEESKTTSSYSSTWDLLALSNFALENETFAQIAATKSITIPEKMGEHKAYYLENILQLDSSFQGVKGIKPGNSVFARETLVSYAERENRKILLVLLGSSRTKDDAVEIYKKVFGK